MSSINLLFSPSMRVGGEVLHGEVELRFPQVIQDEIEEVHVKLRGKVYAKVARQLGQTYQWRVQRIEVARENVSVWTKGTAYPEQGSEVLRLPFQLQLPVDVQPSCQFSGVYKKAYVAYFLEVVGVRTGVLSANRRVMRPFAVVPNDISGANLRCSLQSGWTGAYDTLERFEKIRRGLWGGYADVEMELKMPYLRMFPLFVKIPITLRITTTTKEMKYDEKDEQETVFPEPPLHPKEVEFSLRRDIHLNARGWKAIDSETITYLGGMGKAASSTLNGNGGVVTTFEKKWTPSANSKHLGFWTQETVMQTVIELKSTPSFSTPILSQRNYLRIKIGFLGIGNRLDADIPIEITSGMKPPSAADAAPPYDGPPAALDLPPTYWAATDWDTSDEKVDPFASSD